MADDAPPEQAKILIVDDRVENLIALEAILQPLGHRLIRADSGEEALRQVLRHDFAVLLLDVQMPGMNGFEAAQLIKARERSRHTPIIFLTAISKDEEYVFEGYSAGAVDYMFKPFNPDILRSKVSVFVDLYMKGQQLQRQSEMLRESERRELELRHRSELLEAEARYADIAASALEAIITFGDDRRISLFNRSAERIFEVDAREMLSRSIDALFEGGLDESVLRRARERSAGKHDSESPLLETTCLRGDGGPFPAELSLSCLPGRDERMYTLILRDISERRYAEEVRRAQAISLANTAEELRVLNEELNVRTVELERAMGARSRFYANMSHELRTPINAIMGYTSLMLEHIYGPLTEQQTMGIERTHRAAGHLLHLVNDVLDLSKIEAGRMELHMETMRFPDLLDDLLITVSPLAEQNGVALTVEAASEPFEIVSDPRRVQQILLNLLSNAIKFGAGRPVRVVWTERADGGLVVEVADQGQGIATEDQERVFEEFVQLQSAEQGQGTGLGLPISRRLAEILGGSLVVASTPGEGSTFTLDLPPTHGGGAEAATSVSVGAVGRAGASGHGISPEEVGRSAGAAAECE